MKQYKCFGYLRWEISRLITFITLHQDHHKAVSSLWDLKSRSLDENYHNDAAVHFARNKKPGEQTRITDL